MTRPKVRHEPVEEIYVERRKSTERRRPSVPDYEEGMYGSHIQKFGNTDHFQNDMSAMSAILNPITGAQAPVVASRSILRPSRRPKPKPAGPFAETTQTTNPNS